jgi:hypothetical protein
MYQLRIGWRDLLKLDPYQEDTLEGTLFQWIAEDVTSDSAPDGDERYRFIYRVYAAIRENETFTWSREDDTIVLTIDVSKLPANSAALFPSYTIKEYVP